MLDLFCGRWGWSRAFAARGWECVGVDLVEPPEIPDGCEFIQADILTLRPGEIPFKHPDFICASPPCEQFSVFGMKHFHPEPPLPVGGLRLFMHTQDICRRFGVPHVIENVRAAQQFVDGAVNHCGPFYLWGNAVPPLLPQGITKGIDVGSSKAVKTMTKEEKRVYRLQFEYNQAFSWSDRRRTSTARVATIPPELAACVADYATEICSQIQTKGESRG